MFGMHDAADRMLLNAVAQGDEDAWSQIVTCYSGRLHAFASGQLGRRGAEAEDLVQETFLALLQTAGGAEGIHSIEAFLFVVLRRKIIDLRRRCKAENLTDSQWRHRTLSPIDTPSRSAAEAEEALRSERGLTKAMAEYLDNLKAAGSYREIVALELLFMSDRPNKAIGNALGLSPVQVTRVKQAALEFLRAKVLDLAPLADSSLHALWERRLFGCLKRSVLGQYELDLLPGALKDYVQLHLTLVECPYCLANLQDLREESAKLPALNARILATSTPFLRRPGQTSGGA